MVVPVVADVNDRVFRADNDERILIGSCLRWPNYVADLRTRLTSADFFRDDTRRVFKAIEAVTERGEPALWTSVQAELLGEGASVNAEARLAVTFLEWMDMAVSSAYFQWHALNVLRASERRRLVQAGRRVTDIALDGKMSVEQAVESAQRVLSEVRRTHHSPIEVLSPWESAAMAEERLRQREQGGDPRIVATGLRDLDERLYGGVRPGQLVVIGARTAVGKSALLREITRNMARKGPVLYASNEMTAAQLQDRDLAAYANVPLEVILRGNWTARERDDLVKGNLRLASTPVEEYVDAAMSSARLRQHAREVHARLGIVALVVDYLQRMSDPGHSDVEKVGYTARALKSLALELDVPVLTASQVVRGDRDSLDHRPTLTELRSSGEIEQEADIVLLLYRASANYPDVEAWKKAKHNEPYPGNVSELLIGKNRQGESGQTVKLVWLPAIATFRDLARRDDADGSMPF